MFRRLALTNFKLFQELTFHPAAITVFIGANGSGKSSVFQALALLKQSRGSKRLKLDGPVVQGGIEDFQRRTGPDVSHDFSVGMDLTVDGSFAPFFPHAGLFSYDLTFRDALLQSHRATIWYGEEPFLSGSFDGATGQQTPSRDISEPSSQVVLNIQPRLGMIGCPFQIGARQGLPDTPFEQAAQRLFCFPQEAMENLFVVPALRGFNALTYQLLPDPVEERDLMSFSSMEGRAQALASILLRKRPIEQQVSSYTSQVTGRTIDHQLGKNYHIALETSDGGAKFNVLHEGFGTNQLYYLFTQIALAGPESVVCIDEPEIHLHPAGQAALARLLADITREERQQLLMATHSEHLLMGLATAVAEGRLQRDDLAVYYFSRTDGTATAERLEVTPQGQIVGGLKGFFEVEVEEMTRYLQALATTQRA